MGFHAYEELINLQLLWQMKNLIRRVSTEDTFIDTGVTLFGERETEQGLEEMYQLRYPGEVLERYQDKCGNSSLNMRALAIALAEMREVLEDGMFVGGQKTAFLGQIRQKASEDVFLKGALFLLTDRNAEKMQLEEELKQYTPGTTQEFVYMQSVMKAGSYGYDLDMEQCIRFFGPGRSAKVYGNQWIYVWVLRNFLQKITSYRRNDGKYLKVLVQMLSRQVKEDTDLWRSLIDAGYSRQELIYLHMNLPLSGVPGGRLYKDSITMERIVTWGISEILNAEHVESPALYEEIKRFLGMYAGFAIHIEGCSGLPEILKNRVRLQDADLFLFLYEEFHTDRRFADWFRVNLIEDKWDKLAARLASDDYLDLFEYCFLGLAESGQEKDWMEKYEKLRGGSYFSQFWSEYRSDAVPIFDKLVRAGVFDIVGHLDRYAKDRADMDAQLLDEKWHHMLKFMAGSASRMECHAVFEFWEKYVHLYGMAGLRAFLGNRDIISGVINFSKGFGYKDQKLFEGLDFLTKEEKTKLFYWECDELFSHDAENYNRFLECFLNESAADLFPREQCRGLFEIVMPSLDEDSRDAERLRNIYFSGEELDRFARIKKERREEAEREKQQELLLRWKSELSDGIDDGSKGTRLGLIAKNANVYKLDKGYFKLAYGCIMNEIDAGYRQIEPCRLSRLLELLGKIVEKQACGWDDVCGLIKQMEVVKSGSGKDETEE